MPTSRRPPARRRLIYIDLAYTLRIVRGRHHEDYWHARHSSGYFPIVWGIHPFADIPDGEQRRQARVKRFSPGQIVIEGSSQSLDLPRALFPLNLLISQWALFRGIVKHAKRSGVSAVFANDPLYCGLFGALLARRLDVPLIVFVPAQFDELYEATGTLGNPRIFRFRKVEQAVMRFVFPRAEMVFAVADSVEALALKYGAKPDAIARLSHGKYLASTHLADPASRGEIDDVLERYGIARTGKYLICVGRQTAVKHPEDALRAMKVAMDGDPDVVGIMAGEGDLTAQLRAEAEQLGIASRVVFPGLIDQPSLSKLLPHCVTLSPLTGMALVESSLAGSPTVAYDRDWQGEFVKDGESGFVVPFGDWELMGTRALQILRDRALHERFSAAARGRAVAFVDTEGNRAKEQTALDAMFERWANRA